MPEVQSADLFANWRRAVATVSACFFLACGCTVGPNYKRASAPMAPAWQVQEPWREGIPKDGIPKGEWWSVFQDSDLTTLEQEALRANQSVQAAMAQLEQSRATAAVQVSTLYPALSAGPSALRERLSGNRAAFAAGIALSPLTQNVFTLPFTVSYEVDIFGQRRRGVESAEAAYQSSAASLENIRLLVTSQLAADYFNLRQLDSESGILNRTVESLQKGLQLVNSRHIGGVASGLDVAEEESLLNATRAQAVLLQQSRKQYEDAIAVLAGRPAPELHIAPRELSGEPPPIDAGLPSDLLERRPDIAIAERQMAAANAQIGVAKAAFYPSLNLIGQGGWVSTAIASLVNAPSAVWSLGAAAAQPIFEGGALRAQYQYAQASYNVTIANYRQTVLTGLGEVQDSVSGLFILNDAQQRQQEAVNSAQHTLDISTDRYRGGLVSYLDVVTAQQNLLSAQQQLAVIQGQRLVTSVLLVKALGGGWDAASLAAVRVKPTVKDLVTP